MNRRAGIAAVVTVSAIVFVIRVAVVVLRKEATPPPSPVVDRSRSSPVLPPSPAQTKEEANARLMTLASEARAAKELKAATAAYDAQRALAKDDCAATKSAVARAGDDIASDSSIRGAFESAARSVSAYCDARE